jgi:hypothetical protein
MMTETGRAESAPEVRAVLLAGRSQSPPAPQRRADRWSTGTLRTADREPLEHAIKQYIARRQDEPMTLVDRVADANGATGAGAGRRGAESPTASAVAGAVAAIVALLVFAALAVRVIG